MNNLHHQKEIELASRLKNGESGLFDQFAASIGPRLINYGLLICRQRDDAQDIVQETLLEVFLRFPELRDPCKVHAWFFRIARNACMMQRRKQGTAAESKPVACDYEVADPSSLPEAEMLRKENEDALIRAIEELPKDQRMILSLRYFEGLSTEDVAYALDMTTEAVKAKLYRVRTAIRKKLQMAPPTTGNATYGRGPLWQL